jgi:uncharacterized protein YkwD
MRGFSQEKPARCWPLPALVTFLVIAPLLIGQSCINPPSDGSGDGVTGSDEPVAVYSCITVDNVDELRTEVLDQINQQRVDNGLSPVEYNAVLGQMAQDFCCDMVVYDFFPSDHINPYTGEQLDDRAEQAGYVYLSLGENLAWGQDTPQQVVEAWMNSTAHRKVIITPQFIEAGVGIADGHPQGLHWVLEMGEPRPSVIAKRGE